MVFLFSLILEEEVAVVLHFGVMFPDFSKQKLLAPGIEVVEQMRKESAEQRRHPEVNAYLDAELALCKMMQRICIKLGEGIDIDVPGM